MKFFRDETKENRVAGVRFWRAVSGVLIGLVCIFLLILSVLPVYAQGENLSIWLWDAGHQQSKDIKVGDILELEVWMNVGSTQAQGVSFYLSFDENYFEAINLTGDELNFKPFDFTIYVSCYLIVLNQNVKFEVFNTCF